MVMQEWDPGIPSWVGRNRNFTLKFVLFLNIAIRTSSTRNTIKYIFHKTEYEWKALERVHSSFVTRASYCQRLEWERERE
ncbi:unnamed protein product, partial [Vitis vinifera]|uniref:Uncharacterized protein n=1 Tax=Vitis vinifera TaxID=29760 RepID=D7TM30_VITVI